MKRKVMKIIFSILLISAISLIAINSIYADWSPNWEAFDNQDTGNTGKMVTNAGSTIIRIFQIVGIGIAVAVTIGNGILYMAAATGARKAEVKSHLFNSIIGLIFILAASALLEIVKMFFDDNLNNYQAPTQTT